MAKEPYFFDGAMGTYYVTLSGEYRSCEYANIHNPAIIRRIHREYLDAGVNAITTNTFGANPIAIPDEDDLAAVISAGYRIACEEAAGRADVFADIGYFHCDDPQMAQTAYLKVAGLFLDLGAVNYIFETFPEFEIIGLVAAYIKENRPDARILVSFAVSLDGYSQKGNDYKTLLQQAQTDPNIDIIGLNCNCGPNHMLRLLKKLGTLEKPLSVMPNAGYPSSLGGRAVFQENAEYFARTLVDIGNTGADILGGCCGTTPRHIAKAIAISRGDETDKKRGQTDVPGFHIESPERLKKKPIYVELDAPLDAQIDSLLHGAKSLHDSGTQVITISDSPLARTRADSIITAARVRREIGVDVLPHISCRDRNHIALTGALMGAVMEGIDRVLIVTGDPAPYGVKGVFGFNSFELISLVNNLNQQLFQGREMKIGAALNVNAPKFDVELARAKKKQECGASFFLTQPIFSDTSVDNFKRAKEQLDAQMFAGIWPITSYKNALFLNNEVTGIDIPEHVIEQFRGKKRQQAYELSITYSCSIIERIYQEADGFYIMTPLGKVDLVTDLIKRCFYESI